MFEVFHYAALATAQRLRDSMLRDRADQFVRRHNWPLPLTQERFEIDEFDTPATDYCIVSEERRHAASVRIRHARDGSMVERHFPEFWQGHAGRLRGHHEVTRLCTAPRGRLGSGVHALPELLIGLCGHCLRQDIPLFFGVVFPPVARALQRAGWPPTLLGRLDRAGETLLLATWPVTHRVHWDLQSELERRLGALAAETRQQAA